MTTVRMWAHRCRRDGDIAFIHGADESGNDVVAWSLLNTGFVELEKRLAGNPPYPVRVIVDAGQIIRPSVEADRR